MTIRQPELYLFCHCRPKKDKYRHKSEVVKYDPAEDNTAFKRKTEETPEEETPKKKVKKEKKVKEEPAEEPSEEAETPSKKVSLLKIILQNQNKMKRKWRESRTTQSTQIAIIPPERMDLLYVVTLQRTQSI